MKNNYLNATIVNTFLGFLKDPGSCNGLDASVSANRPALAKMIHEDITKCACQDEQVKKCCDDLGPLWSESYVMDVLNRNRKVSPISLEDVKYADELGMDVLIFTPVSGVSSVPGLYKAATEVSSIKGLRIEE